MLSAIDVAKHIIGIGYDPERPDDSVFINRLRLQKLLYYCQGWSLALLGRPLFQEQFQAWVDGPVVRSVYEAFPGHASGLIAPQMVDTPLNQLSETEAALVEMVWKEYSHYTPRELVNKTHNEPGLGRSTKRQRPTGSLDRYPIY